MDCPRRVGDAALPVGLDPHSRPELRALSPGGRAHPKSARFFLQPASCSPRSPAATQGAMSSPGSRCSLPRIPRLPALVPVVQLPFALSTIRSAMAWTTAVPPEPVAGDVRCHARRAVLEGRWRAVVARRVSTFGDGTFPIIMQIYGGSWQTGAPASDEWFSRHFAAARVRGRGDRLSSRAGVEMAGADRRCADGAVLDLAGRRRNSTATRAASSSSDDRQEHSSRCASPIRKVRPPFAAW